MARRGSEAQERALPLPFSQGERFTTAQEEDDLENLEEGKTYIVRVTRANEDGSASVELVKERPILTARDVEEVVSAMFAKMVPPGVG